MPGADNFSGQQRRIAEHPEGWNPIRADGKRECAVCTNSFKALDGPLPLVAHFDYATSRWCPGGMPATPAERAARKRKVSIRAWRG